MPPSRRALLTGSLALAGLGLAVPLARRLSRGAPSAHASVGPAAWASAGRGPTAPPPGIFPAADAPLDDSPAALASAELGAPVMRVYLDAGHGAPDNPGNTSCQCEAEASFSLRACEAIAHELEATGRFLVMLSRAAGELPRYQERVLEAERFGADVLVSVHSDIRTPARSWQPRADVTCPLGEPAPGLSILFSDEGDAALVEARRRVALGLARAAARRGFPFYPAYERDYEPLVEARGVFVDRHPAGKRIFLLRATSMPAILVETHHALDPFEVERWNEPRTVRAFSRALGEALERSLGEPS
jgi:N-acetylmuramoyl-L-alanine amidase